MINRTLVYGTVTATLVLAYLICTIAVQQVLPIAGSDLWVAASTLGVAALFTPVREHTQRAVDRRFYRSRYDAQRTLEEFAVTPRGEIDLEMLRREFVGAVGRTMQPTHASVWLRPS